MEEYTKGEWIVRGKQSMAYSGFHIWDNTQGILTKDVAIVYPNPQGKADAYGEANARLISAAPDLYEACKGLVAVKDREFKGNISNQGQGLDGFSLLANYEAIVADARKALAKAEGKH